LRNFAIEKLTKDLEVRKDNGALMENIILKELLILREANNMNLRFWRSKQKSEVDFVIQIGEDIIPLEVKSNIQSDKLPRSFIGFIKRYNPKKAFIINLNISSKRIIGNTEVNFILPWNLNKIFDKKSPKGISAVGK